MEPVMDAIGLMSEVDELFHARKPFFVLKQFVGVAAHRVRLLRERSTLISSLLQNLCFVVNVLFVKDGFDLVFMMTFLMRDLDELFHAGQALFTFLTFTVREPHSASAPLAKFFIFQFHFRIMTHRHGAAPERKHLFALDVAYHAVEWSLAFSCVTGPAMPPLRVDLLPLLLAHSCQALALFYHTYVLWTFLRWIKITLPIVQTTEAARRNSEPVAGGVRLLSPAMSRLLLSLLEAQGGNVPMLRLFQRVVRLQERVRNLARILERRQLGVAGDGGAPGGRQQVAVWPPGSVGASSLPVLAPARLSPPVSPPHRSTAAALLTSIDEAQDEAPHREVSTGAAAEDRPRHQ
ncbi:uncharacterized protein LOC144122895 [Amblyomma americanum]